MQARTNCSRLSGNSVDIGQFPRLCKLRAITESIQGETMRQTLALPLRMLIGAVGGCVVGFVAMTWRDWAVEARLAIAPVARQSPAPARVFASDAAIMVKYIKPDKTADFEATIARLKEAL